MIEAEWNADLGIWVNPVTRKAVVKVDEELHPDEPLYIFGYGSLIWRPGDLLQDLDSWEVDCISHTRLFGQFSHDHRGNPEFPGLVCTLYPVSLADLEIASSRSAEETCSTESSICSGRMWLVPKEKAVEVLEQLDYREKGGYSRSVITVRLMDDKDTPYHKRGSICRSVVYLATASNPNFFSGSLSKSTEKSVAIHSASAIQRTANIISVAVGPSGRNTDYLFNLSNYLHTVAPSYQSTPRGDGYLRELCEAVWSRCYSCHDSWYRHYCTAPHGWGLRPPVVPSATAGGSSSIGSVEEWKTMAWGSNEYGQLQCNSTTGDEYWLAARNISLPDPISTCPNLEVTCGGGTTLVLSKSAVAVTTTGIARGTLYVNGQLCIGHGQPESVRSDVTRVVHGVAAACMGHDHALVLLCSNADSERTQLVELHRDGALQASTHQCNKSKLTDGPAFVHRAELNKLETHSDVFPFNCQEKEQEHEKNQLAAELVVHAAAGMRHRACVTADGRAHVWGDNRHGQAPGSVALGHAHRAREAAGGCMEDAVDKIVRVACGSRHTIFVTSMGRVYSIGADKHGALGRPATNEASLSPGNDATTTFLHEWHRVGTDPRVRWIDVSCGWAHNVAKGVGADGEYHFAVWGRCDLGQISTSSAACTPGELSCIGIPEEISPPPHLSDCADKQWLEVWTGSEHTVACDDQGKLWSTGWAAHGVLGHGSNSTGISNIDSEQAPVGTGEFCVQWKQVVDRNGVQLQLPLNAHGTVKRGLLGCGGGHCVAVATIPA